MSRWVIVLGGAEGSRIRQMIRGWLGTAVPKQYCTFCGTRPMLEHTLGRAARLVDPERIIIIIGRGQRRFHFGRPDRGLVIEQPGSRGTAPGVFLPAAMIRVVDPTATGFILLSDQYVFPESKHTRFPELGANYAGDFRKLVLFGARPDRPEREYGWIEPGTRLADAKDPALHRAEGFKEKPGQVEADNRMRRGHFWNTMMIAVPLGLLWALGRRCLPSMMIQFDRFVGRLRRVGLVLTGTPGSCDPSLPRWAREISPVICWSRQQRRLLC